MDIPVFALLFLLATSITATPTALDRAVAQTALTIPKANVEITNRGDSSDVLQIDSIQIDPNTVEPGSSYTITLNGTLTAPLKDGAYMRMTIHIGLIKLLEKQYDLCDNDLIKLDCPVQKGEVSWTTEESTLPLAMPLAKFRIGLIAFTVDDDDLSNLEAHADFMKKQVGFQK